MKIIDLYEALDDKEARNRVREILLIEPGESLDRELHPAELKQIAMGGPLWELSFDELEPRELERYDDLWNLRFYYEDSDSGLVRVYSNSKEKLIQLYRTIWTSATLDDIQELEDDNYLQKVV